MDRPPLASAAAIAGQLGTAGRERLLALAYAGADAAARGRRLSPAEYADAPDLPLFGAFVTLNRGGELRGCIGSVGRVLPAARLVADAAYASTVEDPRFPPVTPDELPELTIDVSLLTPLEWLEPHRLPEAVVVGEHGLVAERGAYRGLLLPQVATEWGWDAEQFLAQTCRKAGLPATAWREGARIARFAALVLS